ncbi:MAG: branched-chain amino acid transport system substrate-binding protein [Gammaproteobacteria bacterium]|jgi:branched-chain amino acid transport system substrate-binding protein
MKKILIASTILATLSAPVIAKDINVGIILGFTGPIESLTPTMAAAAELALSEASNSGNLLGGQKVVPIRGDSTCIDAAAATSTAERLITSEGVVAIMGADCSGVTTAIANNVAVPNGVVMVSPSATSPALSTIDDNGFFHRTAPSDARQGQVLTDILIGRGIKEVAVTYTNNDYGKGLADSFGGAFRAKGGVISISAAHEDGKADYSAEVGALSASGSKYLAVFGYLDQGGKGIVQASIDSDAFRNFVMADGMVGESILAAIGSGMNGTIATVPGGSSGADAFLAYAKENGVAGDGPYAPESYDAAALIVLAIQAAGSTDRAAIQSKMNMVANAPGKKIGPGELGKALKIIAAGGDVDYQGATNVEFDAVGEVFGSYKELEVNDGKWVTVKVH